MYRGVKSGSSFFFLIHCAIQEEAYTYLINLICFEGLPKWLNVPRKFTVLHMIKSQ